MPKKDIGLPSFIIQTDSGYTFLSDSGQAICTIANTVSDSLSYFSEDLLLWHQDSLLGLLDSHGNTKLPPLYNRPTPLPGDSVLIATNIFTQKNVLIPLHRDSLIYLNNHEHLQPFDTVKGWAGVSIYGHFGFIDVLGRIRVAHRYDSVRPFVYGMAAVKLGNKWGFIDRTEKLRVQPYYDTVQPFQTQAAIVKKDTLYGLVNRDGVEKVAVSYNNLYPAGTGFIGIKKNKYAFFDSHGETVMAPYFDHIEALPVLNPTNKMSTFWLRFTLNGKQGINDPLGNQRIPAIYEHIVYDTVTNLFIITSQPKQQIIEIKN